jgi:hypothetical protein
MLDDHLSCDRTGCEADAVWEFSLPGWTPRLRYCAFHMSFDPDDQDETDPDHGTWRWLGEPDWEGPTSMNRDCRAKRHRGTPAITGPHAPHAFTYGGKHGGMFGAVYNGHCGGCTVDEFLGLLDLVAPPGGHLTPVSA